MPRRRAETAEAIVNDNDSQKENTPAIKTEKSRVKQEAAKKQAAGGTDDDQLEGSPRGAKRSRVNIQGDSRPQIEVVSKTLPRDTDGYIPGSIVRIQLQNFVTYDFAEFRPGSHLNMIIGPNGTGKSSIACAICLGLNFPPAILGRANDVRTFVKTGTSAGYIEIELKAPKGQPNLVVRRNINSTNNTTNFTLNGQAITAKAITETMAELNIQVGNLCSFLPQDKVSEFAAMSPQQLLKETQRAAGDENLSLWHQTLIKAGKELRELEDTIKAETSQLNQLRERNEGIERDVQRVRERQQIEQEIAFLELLLPIQHYREIRVKFLELKATQRRLHTKVAKMKNRNKEAHDLMSRMDRDAKKLEKQRDALKDSTQSLFSQMNKKWTEGEELETKTEDMHNRLENLDREEKERANKIRSIEATIKKTKEEIAKPGPTDTEAGLKEEFQQINLERRDVQARQAQTDGEMRANIDRRDRIESEERTLMHQMNSLQSVDTQKLRSLAQFDRDTHDVLIWLRNNQDKFREPIIEPPFMALTITPGAGGRIDSRVANAVESCFSFNQLKSFIAQNHEDYNTLNRLVQDGNAIGRKVRVTTWFRGKKPGLYVDPPMHPQELQELGFDGYAIDFVSFPEGMLWFLQCDLNLHRTAIALRSDVVDIQRAMTAVGRSGGANFVTAMTMHQVSRSRYGKKEVQNITRNLRPARALNGTKVDLEAQARIETQMGDVKGRLLDAKQEHDELKQRLDAIYKEDAVFTDRVTALKERRKAIQAYQAQQLTQKGNLNRYQNQLAAIKNAPSAEHERTEIKRKISDLTKKRVAILGQYATLARSVVTEQSKATRLGLEFLQICANKSALKGLIDEKEKNFQKVQAEYHEADRRYRDVKAQSQEALDTSREVLANAAEPLATRYHAIEEVRYEYEQKLKAGQNPSPEGVDLRSAEELNVELEAQKTKLEITLATNPGVIEQYEKRKKEIESLEKTVDEGRKKAEKIDRNIKTAKDKWKPALEELVSSIGSRFSAAFDRIGCAGEIKISEHEDYDKWAIDILVKFREEERLQLLTGQRQSGGERSLTTILYLMALTEEARAPFSLVDEINQGMDQRAERAVHNSMVEVTCKEDSAQYFLITPKLLADLDYHERMKILCVNNGEWLPEDRGLGNMMGLIEGYVAIKNRSRSN